MPTQSTTRSRQTGDPLRMLLQQSAPIDAAVTRVALSRLQPEIARRTKAPPSSDSQSFFASIVRSLGTIRSGSNIELRIECLFNCAIYFYNNGCTDGFLTTIHLLDDLARRSDSSIWVRKIQMFGGVCHADIGNVAEAVVRYALALETAHRATDIAGEVAVLCNLGVALNYGGLHRESIPPLRRALSLAGKHCDLVDAAAIEGQSNYFECVALTNLAQSYHMLGDDELALKSISRCLSLTPAPVSSLSATNLMLRVVTYVNVALQLGLVSEARERISQSSIYKGQAGTRGQFMLEVARGLCDVYAGDVRVGITALEALLIRSDLASTKISVLRALAKALDQSGQPLRALHYVEILINIIRETRSKATAALLSTLPITGNVIAPESDDLVLLHLARAEYKARAAEIDVIDTRIEALERLAITADLREEATGGHGYRVGRLASLFAFQLGWHKGACYALDLAGRLHDIGKIGLPDQLMLKPETLKHAERKFVAAHAEIGAELLAHGTGEILHMARDVAKYHHEKWNGSGYPLGLAEGRIPMSARIIALADVFDALTHGRPYSRPLHPSDAIEAIRNQLGAQFDPTIGIQFVEFVQQLAALHPDLDVYLGESGQCTAFTSARKRIDALLREAGHSERETAETS